jgi:hypothetical protein
MGFFGISAADEIMLADAASLRRRGVETERLRPVISGDEVRDWSAAPQFEALFPYDTDGLVFIESSKGAHRWLWPAKTYLGGRVTFSKKTYLEEGRPWWEWHQIALDRIRTPLTITFGEVATHNHFVLDRGGKVFNQTAPVIKLPAEASEDEHLGLLGLLNSSVACFWMKQVCFPKGGDQVGNAGARVRKTLWDERYAFNATNVAEFPLVESKPTQLATRLDALAREIASQSPAALLARAETHASTRATLNAACEAFARLRGQQIATQEELDWRCYGLYGLLPVGGDRSTYEHPAAPEVALGERAFEIVLARRMAAGTETTTWFERHGSTPTLRSLRTLARRLPPSSAVPYRLDRARPQHRPDRAPRVQAALEHAVLGFAGAGRTARLAARPAGVASLLATPGRRHATPQLTTVHQPALRCRARDADFMQIAELYADHADFDAAQLVAKLVTAKPCHFCPCCATPNPACANGRSGKTPGRCSAAKTPTPRSTDSELEVERRLRTHGYCEENRRGDSEPDKDALDRFVPPQGVPVPPKYKDFLKSDFWRLRGGLDVPKERWVSYPGCERGATAAWLSPGQAGTTCSRPPRWPAYYLEMKDNEGWEPARLHPLLAGLLELVPWLEQWHNEIDPEFGQRMGTYYRGFVTEEARALGFTLDDLRTWKPAVVAAKRGRKKAAAANENV